MSEAGDHNIHVVCTVQQVCALKRFKNRQKAGALTDKPGKLRAASKREKIRVLWLDSAPDEKVGFGKFLRSAG